MGMQEIGQLARDLIDGRAEIVVSRYRSSVRPIYGSEFGTNLELLGSCMLLKRNDAPYVVTAAHLADWSPSYGLYVAGALNTELVQILGEILSTKEPEEGRDHDNTDIAIWKMTEDDVERLGDIKFITEDDISPNLDDTCDRLYTAFGYPLNKNRKSIDNDRNVIKMVSWKYSDAVHHIPKLASELGISGADHLFLNFRKYSQTPDGKKVSSPIPRGMNGGALIDAGDKHSVIDPEPGKSDFGHIAGMILQRHKKHSALVAVKIQSVTLMIDWHAREIDSTSA